MIETIEMIEMIWGSVGRRYVARGSEGGVESMSFRTFGVSAPAVVMGFPYELEVFLQVPILVFPIRPRFKILAFRF